MTKSIRMRGARLLASVAIGAVVVALTPMLGAWPQATAQAQVAISAEFRTALSPYGRWHRHARWGDVWIVNRVSSDWRPYSRGRWLYTEEWGWYWDVGTEEADWGWVTYHYGRWVNDRALGWVWVPGKDWGPAWVDWRYGDEYVGWAPLPPDDLLIEYRDDPVYWSFVRPRYLLAPRVYLVFARPRDRIVIIRRTKIVNRTVIVDRDRNRDRNRDRPRSRVAVNRGIEPGIIARATGKPIRAAKVEPAVLRGTKVDGAREVDAREGRRARASIKETNTVIKPADKIDPPRELDANEKGRLRARPPKAAQDGNGSGNESRSGDNRSGGNRSSDQGRSSPPPPPAKVIRGGSNEAGRNASPPPPPPAVNERRVRERTQTKSPPPPAVRRPPPPPPKTVRRSPPPPPAATRASPPPPPAAAKQRRAQEQRRSQEQRGGNRQNNRKQDQNRR